MQSVQGLSLKTIIAALPAPKSLLTGIVNVEQQQHLVYIYLEITWY